MTPHRFAWLATCIASIVLVAPMAHAQMAGALGKPLPSADLPTGTISVRIVAGSVASPVANTEVTLVVNGAPRVARTDSEGRVQFRDLPESAIVRATVVDADSKPIQSDEFPVPAEGGARVMLSTKPFVPMGGGQGAMGSSGAAAAMPAPRQMSGEPRPEPSDPPGTLTVRLTYDDFSDRPPVDVPVMLVGYTAQEQVEIRTARTDRDGRAQFTNLDRTGAVAYFALAQLVRNGAIDRAMSSPAALDGRSGVRVVLSAAKRKSTDPPVDDMARLESQDNSLASGKVRVTLDGVPDDAADVRLVAIRGKPEGRDAVPVERDIGSAKPSRAAPNPADIQARASFQPRPDVPPHQVNIQLHGGAGVNEPIVGASVRIVPAKPGANAAAAASAFSKTPTDGYVELTTASDEPLIAEVNINGKDFASQPFDLAKSGGYLDVEAQWESQGKLVADFDVPVVQPDEVVYAETRMRGVMYRSIPFQPLAAPGRGTRITLYIYPRILFSFSLTSRIDDEFLAVNGQFKVLNNSWAPYVGGSDGLIIPLPKRFKGAVVAEQDQSDVAVAAGEGFRIGRPIPPGGKQFHGGFSIPVESGRVDWSMDLPIGTFHSGMEILETPGMKVQLPASVNGESVTVPKGRFFVLPEISILPKQAMVMEITGLPAVPAWRVWAPRVAGLAVIATVLGGLGFALLRTGSERTAGAARRHQRAVLLDELVALEAADSDPKRRKQLRNELEQLWDDGR